MSFMFEKIISDLRTTHAWILSGGTNTGSMKLAGETVKEGQFLVQDGSGRIRVEIKSSKLFLYFIIYIR